MNPVTLLKTVFTLALAFTFVTTLYALTSSKWVQTFTDSVSIGVSILAFVRLSGEPQKTLAYMLKHKGIRSGEHVTLMSAWSKANPHN